MRERMRMRQARHPDTLAAPLRPQSKLSTAFAELPTSAPKCAQIGPQRGQSGQLALRGNVKRVARQGRGARRAAPGGPAGGRCRVSALQPAFADLDWVEVVEICHTFACLFLANTLRMQCAKLCCFSSEGRWLNW